MGMIRSQFGSQTVGCKKPVSFWQQENRNDVKPHFGIQKWEIMRSHILAAKNGDDDDGMVILAAKKGMIRSPFWQP